MLKQGNEKFVVKKENTISNSVRRKSLFQLKPLMLILLLAVLGLTANASFGATYYVDPSSGSDSASGSSSSPWRTLNKAKSSVRSGDVVNLRPGNYGSVTFTSSDARGTSSSYITYQNDPASSPYSAKFTYILFNSNTSYYITVKGFDVENTGSNDACIKTTNNAQQIKIIDCKTHGRSGGTGPSYANIFIHASKHVLIEDCEVYYGGDWAFAVQLESSNYVTVRGCHVHDIVGSGIRTGGGQDYVIEYNVIHDQRAEWNGSVHGSGISIHSHNTEIRGNIVYNFGNTRPIRFYQSYAGSGGYQNMIVENNLVYKTSDFKGTQWWTEFIDVGSNCVFRNNTFVDDVTITIASGANSSTIAIHDNIVTGRLQIDPHSKWSGISDGSNLFGSLTSSGCGWQCQYDRIDSSSNSKTGVSFSNFFAAQDKHYPYTGAYPYSLSSSSQAVNFGDSYAAPTDMLKCKRVGAPDAGCYEYGGTPDGGGTTPPPNQAPIANAGPDQTLTDIGNDGSEQVILNGIGSTDSDGSIVSYRWTRNGTQIATGSKPTVTLPVGTSTITLTVTDDDNATDTDTVSITISQQDTTPPEIMAVTAAQNSLDVIFNKPLSSSSAQNTANYKIDNGISVTRATLNNNRVTLTTSSHTELARYNFTCSNVTDSIGNKMAQATKQYTYSPGLVGCWMFDESSGTMVKDCSGQENDGSLNGTLRDSLGALSFDGTNDYVSCGNKSSLDLTGSLTITACINPKSFGQGGWGRIADKSSGSNGFSVLLEEASQSLTYVVYGNMLVRSEAQTVGLNKWQHVAVVYNQSNDSVDFYIDGKPVGTTTYTTPPISSSTNQLLLGIRGFDSNRAFDGLIDNVRIYNRPLDSQKIAQIYNADFPFAFYPIGDKTVFENDNLNFEVLPRNSQVQISLSSHTLPTDPGFVDNVFNWNAGSDDAGQYTATFDAADGQIEDSETITITVNNVNRKPQIQTIGDKSVDENAPLTFEVIASDPDGDSVTCSAQSLPTGAIVIENIFEWTPAAGQAGTYNVDFIASDGQLEDVETVTITVNSTTPVEEDIILTIDNGDPETSSTGLWQNSWASGSYESLSVWGRDGDTYTFTFTPAKTGTYNVEMHWTYWESRSDSVPVSITHARGTDTVRVNQLQNGAQWNSLGNYIFEADVSYEVTITSQPYPASSSADGVRFTFVNDSQPPQSEDVVVIIDNNSPMVSTTGTWVVSGATDPFGSDSLWSRDGDTFTYNFTPTESGTYDVEMCWTQWPSRCSSVPVTIEYDGGSDVVYVDQQQNCGQFNSLGNYVFRAGVNYQVTIVSQPAPESTNADAMRFTLLSDDQTPAPQPPLDVTVTIDNDSPDVVTTGDWAVSGAPDPFGSDSLWSRDGDTFTYLFTPDVSGQYDFQMCWTQWPSRASSVPVEIETADGSDTVYVNQQENTSQWNKLANYRFLAGTTYRITITSPPAPASTCADAVRFTLTQ